MRLLYILSVLFLTPISLLCQTTEEDMIIVNQMFIKAKEIKSMSFTMKKMERIKDKIPSQESEVKLSIEPFKIYLKQRKPKDGVEVLYVEGEHGNKAIINPNGFPWVNLSLDPFGTVMREAQHHTIYESGYGYLLTILEHLMNKYQKNINNLVSISQHVTFDNKDCWVIVFNNPNFKYVPYETQNGETLISIAKKFKVSEYMILEKNNLAGYTDLPVGKTIMIPNDYASKLELYVDKEQNLPLVMKVYDDKGLYENYEYLGVKINPTFTNKDFNKNNPDYNF